jgi:hypothetical protein
MSRTNKTWLGGFIATALALFVVASLTGYQRVNGPRCATFTAFGDGYDEYFSIGKRSNRLYDISFDRDNLGSATAQTLTLQYCSLDATATSCADYDFDTTGDSLGNTNILLDNGVIELGGVRGMSGFNFLRIQETGTYVSTASFTLCQRYD